MVTASTYRAYPLDGAMSWFSPTTGTHVRWDAPETRALTRVAPRVVMFSLSHACNLACGFCSRDTAVKSAWTVDSAAELLAGLAQRRVLEVSFGGGEPFAFRGFDRLLRRLHDETELAVHATTNGVLLDDAWITALRGRVGEIRVSVYDETPWEDRIARLADAGIRVAANVLVTPDRLAALPALLARLAEIGARDVAVLSYVGPDPALHLRPDHDAALAVIVAESPLRVRLSVCLGDRLAPLPTAAFGPCGAGLDFVTLGPDKRLKACSFADGGFPIETADDVVAAWRRERAALARPAPRTGCARRGDDASAPLGDGIRIYRAFSGNNSGDCILVGRFDEAADARAYVAALAPGFAAGERFTPEWKALLSAEGIESAAEDYAPDAMLALGRSVMLHTDSTLADDFPSLRELLWKRGGHAVYNGIHEHGQIRMLVGIRSADPARARATAQARLDDPFLAHGTDAYGLLVVNGADDGSLSHYGPVLEQLATDLGAVIAGELVGDHEGSLAKALPSLARDAASGDAWLWVRFFDETAAARAAAALSADEGLVATLKQVLLLRTARVRPRLAARLQHAGGNVTLLRGARLLVSCTFWGALRQPAPDLEDVRMRMRAELAIPFEVHAPFGSPVITTTTDDPGRVLAAATGVAAALGCRLWPSVGPLDPTAAALGRVRDDLVTLSRRPRAPAR